MPGCWAVPGWKNGTNLPGCVTVLAFLAVFGFFLGLVSGAAFSLAVSAGPPAGSACLGVVFTGRIVMVWMISTFCSGADMYCWAFNKPGITSNKKVQTERILRIYTVY